MCGQAYNNKPSFFLACGPMDEHYCDPVQWVIAQAQAQGVSAYFLDQTGFECNCCGHPCTDADTAIGKATASSIAGQLGWDVVESV